MKKLIDIIREMYPMTRNMSEVHSISLYNALQEDQNLNEMLGTVNHEKVKGVVKNLPGVEEIIISDEKMGGGKISPAIEITINDPGVNLDGISDKLEKFGWFPAFVRIGYHSGGKFSKFEPIIHRYDNATVRYEAKYDVQIDVSSKSILCHVTTDLQYKNIQKIGLTPKSQGKLSNHPGRIYLLQNYDDDEIYEIATQLLMTYKNKDLVNKICVLIIETENLKNHKFYEDPDYHMSQAIYTYQNIPPAAIYLEKEIVVK